MNWLYKINQDITGNLKKDTPQYRYYKTRVDGYGIQRQQQKSETPKDHHGSKKQKRYLFHRRNQLGREVTPENTLTRGVLAAIRQIKNDDELADFAVRNLKQDGIIQLKAVNIEPTINEIGS